MKFRFSTVISQAVILALLVSFTQTLHAQSPYRGFNVSSSITSSNVEALAPFGVNVVRFQLSEIAARDYNATEYLAWLDDRLDRLDSLLPLFEQQGIRVILNLHTPPGGFHSIDKFPLLKIFTEAWARDTFKHVWEMMTERYLGDDRIYAFEILNEPATGIPGASPLWRNLAISTVRSILARDPKRKIIIQGDYANMRRLGKITKRLRRSIGARVYARNIIHTTHIYSPYDYTHQGVQGLPENIVYPSETYNVKYLKKELRVVRRLQRKLKLKKLQIGEFSVVRWAPGAATFLSDLISLFERHRWGWTYHVFRESDAWSVEHSSRRDIIERVNGETDRASVLKGFFAQNTPL